MARASVVIPSRGGRTRLPVLFESLRGQTHQDFEALVVIDGDIDDSESLVRRTSRELPVHAIVFPENRGRAAALNAGFLAATGDVLIRSDDDLELEPDFLEHHLRLHAEAPRGVIAMCRDVFPDTPYARAYGVESDESIRAAAFGTTPDSTWRWWSGNVSTTRDDFHRVGPYDQAFRAYGWEDVEWGYRLHLTGREILVAPGFATLHHGPVTSSAERLERAFASGAARARFVAKHPDALSEEPDALSAWNVLVRASALAMTSVTATKTGRALDRVVDRLPRYVAHKAVALGVQSAAMAGRRAAGSGA